MGSAALLLAAGGSRRFATGGEGGEATHKLLADWHSEPVVRHCARTLVDAGIGRILAVAGARGAEVERALAPLGIESVRNDGWADGMGGSLALGVATLVGDGAPDAILVALADMPLLRAADHAHVLGAHDRDDPMAVTRGAVGGRPGHPVVFGKGWFARLAALSGDEGAGSLLRGHAVRLVGLDAETQRDVDTPEALAAARDVGRR